MTRPDVVAVFTYLQTISCEINRFRNDDDYLDLRLHTREGSKKIHLCFSSPFVDIGSFKTLLRCWNNRENLQGWTSNLTLVKKNTLCQFLLVINKYLRYFNPAPHHK